METLPEEVLDLVFARLSPKDFLTLCSTSKTFYEQHHLNPFYWRNEAWSTFRLPISSLLRADGARWYWLYKKLKTQTRLFTWGQGTNGNLGRSQVAPELPPQAAGRPLITPPRGPLPRIRGHPRIGRPPNPTWERTSSAWPTQVHLPDEVGIIVDVQCGGWSTNLLTSDGKLFSVGILDAANMRHVGKRFYQFTQLEYLTQSSTSVRQFSAGRRHILALDDNGGVLSWDRINEKGYKIFARDGSNLGGHVRYVCAGWGCSSAYVPSKGIVYWHPVENDRDDVMLDGVHVNEFTIPDTASQRQTVGDREVEVTVQKHIVLEGWIVFLWGSSLNDIESKLYACRIGGERDHETSPINPVLEIPGYTAENRQLQDLQGSFRSFAVFTAAGEVLAGNTDYLNTCVLRIRTETSTDDAGNDMAPRAQVQVSDDLLTSRPGDIPILQHHGVIGVAFGDYHCLALHADGIITAHGRDPSGCGALGLGNPPSYAKFRGLRQAGESRDYDLLPIAARRGRQVWFEPEKKDWLEWLDKSLDSCLLQTMQHDNYPYNMIQDSANTQAAFSEWVEQEGRHWRDGPPNFKDGAVRQEVNPGHTEDYGSLDAYFVISVTAAGWHSGALVMVNEKQAESVHQKWMVNSPNPKKMPGHFENEEAEPESEPHWESRSFPAIELPNGKKLGGETTVGWRDGIPSMAELGLRDETV